MWWEMNFGKLWFAFILWSTDICYNDTFHHPLVWPVVICFHSLIYWYLLQPVKKEVDIQSSCDLLSFFDLLIFVTTGKFTGWFKLLLWFAFILWSTDICYNEIDLLSLSAGVVICFHSLIYWYLLQQIHCLFPPKPCCDLLSFFDLLIFVTTIFTTLTF